MGTGMLENILARAAMPLVSAVGVVYGIWSLFAFPRSGDDFKAGLYLTVLLLIPVLLAAVAPGPRAELGPWKESWLISGPAAGIVFVAFAYPWVTIEQLSALAKDLPSNYYGPMPDTSSGFLALLLAGGMFAVAICRGHSYTDDLSEVR